MRGAEYGDCSRTCNSARILARIRTIRQAHEGPLWAHDCRNGKGNIVARSSWTASTVASLVAASFAGLAGAQIVDRIKAPNAANEGIAKTLEQQVGADRGDWYTPESSSFIISRDPFRAIRRGRQLFQRKFSLIEGQGSLRTTAAATSAPISPSARA